MGRYQKFTNSYLHIQTLNLQTESYYCNIGTYVLTDPTHASAHYRSCQYKLFAQYTPYFYLSIAIRVFVDDFLRRASFRNEIHNFRTTRSETLLVFIKGTKNLRVLL